MSDSNLVSTDWLAERLDDSDLVPIDGSWYLPTENRNPYAEFLQKHIPGAVFFDVDSIADRNTDLPHMLPSAEEFSDHMQKLGIANHQTLIVYDGAGMFSAPRVWWTFRVMGMRNVKVLNGGLPKWTSENRPLAEGESTRSPTQFSANLNKNLVVDKEFIVGKLGESDFQIADGRPADRFTGEKPEPRPGLKAGHIPGAVNIPFTKIIDGSGCMKPIGELRNEFNNTGLDLNKPVVNTCGSGVAAAILSLAMTELGKNDSTIYDGSWTEWGGKSDLPVETGK